MTRESFIIVEGLERFHTDEGLLPEKVELALQRAINKTIDRARTRIARAVLDQVSFPASYLSPSSGRLTVSKRASKGNLEGIISGRDQPTSLARFAKQKIATSGSQRPKGGKIDVRVASGGAYHSMPRSFLMKLKNGNIGLAVRTSGEKPRGAYKPKEIGKNLWLLYGPSVDQALMGASGDGVYEQLSPEMLDFLDDEFNRQLDLLGAL